MTQSMLGAGPCVCMNSVGITHRELSMHWNLHTQTTSSDLHACDIIYTQRMSNVASSAVKHVKFFLLLIS